MCIFSLMKHLLCCLIFAWSLLPAQNSPWFYDHVRLDHDLPDLRLQAGEQFGSGVASIGDLDGDGVSEWLVISNGPDSSWIRVIFPDKTGKVLRVHRQLAPAWQGQLPTPGGLLGKAVLPSGYVNADGKTTVFVGEPIAREGPLAYGAVWCWAVDADGKVEATGRWGGRSPLLLSKLDLEGRFGSAMAWVSPGKLLVWAPATPAKGSSKGFLIGVKGSEWTNLLSEYSAGKSSWMAGIRQADQLGSSLAALGDLDGDGGSEILVGAAEDDAAGQGKGSLHWLWFNASGQVTKATRLTPGQAGMRLPLNPDDRFGSSIALLDSLRDSVLTVAVTALKDDDGGKDAGALYMLTLHQRGEVAGWHKISAETYNFEGKPGLKHQFGWALAGAGDHNQDGRPDLLAGGPGDADGTGATWLLMPVQWPERLRDTARWLGSVQLSASDSAFYFREAKTAGDSARISQTYNLSEYAVNHLVFVLDVSASMNKPDRLPLLKEALLDLLPYMRPEDLLTVITYSGKPEVQLKATPVEARDQITATLQGLTSAGETKPGNALKMALELAEAHWIPGGNNRIIFGTDGGFEMADIEKSLALIEASKASMSVFYFGKLPENRIREMAAMAARTRGNAAHISGNSARGALLRESKVVGRRE